MQNQWEEKNGDGEKRGARGDEPAFIGGRTGGEEVLGAMQLRGDVFAAGTPESRSIAHRQRNRQWSGG
jgi:hypothetical protein